MAVPPWVWDDTISDEEKLRRFEKDMRQTILAFAMIPLGVVIGLILKVAGVI